MDDSLIKTFDTALIELAYVVPLWNATKRPKLEMKQRDVFANSYYGTFEDWIKGVWPELDGKTYEFTRFFVDNRPPNAFFPPVEGASGALEYVHNAGLVYGVHTARDSRTIVKVIVDAGFNPDSFGFLCSTQDAFKGCNKSHLEGFEMLSNSLKTLDVDPEKTIYVGDQIDDMNCRKIGAKFVAVCTGVTLGEVFYDHGVKKSDILPSVAHLRSYLESLQ